MSTEAQAGQRATVPGALVKTVNVATSRKAPHAAQVPMAVVISSPKTSASRPAIALPSSVVSDHVGHHVPVGPKRSVLMRVGSWPSPTRALAAVSTNAVGPQT